MGSLTFRFAGVCTHFRNGIVPGVPHRVVLCELTKFLVGTLQIEGQSQGPSSYYTTPHFPQLEIRAIGTRQCGDPLDDPSQATDLSGLLNVPSVLSPTVLKNGDFQSNARLQVINGTDRGMTGNFDGIPALREFFPNYAPASDVMLNGRASCYIDFHGGCSWVTEPGPPLPPFICIRVETDGPPQLMVTPLSSSAPAPAWVIQLPPNVAPDDNFTMIVRNLEAETEVGLGSTFQLGMYDFLLHYVTAQGGIPQVIQRPTPGLDASLPSATIADIGNAFIAIGGALLKWDAILSTPTKSSGNTLASRRKLIPENLVTPACADSVYP